MNKIPKRKFISISDIEYSLLLHEVAVLNGLQAPETPDEVAAFEHKFADDIVQANNFRPSLNDILQLAQEIKSSNSATIYPKAYPVTETRYRMAARNGNEITKETEQLMEEAIQLAKDRQKND
ncbi:hypothetical protein [Kangiella koreensis]|uniref:Uncharacterized protein n=1 Tax=Kangiella koreensis (strain DSM 16069 / JCM 12317 / KCTC 12182 / SW-125) TaxID=523791 RepID=C7R643_KANKD|nr:hypothetical protein [Kangiella koreensis]ACV25474.1 hypothetical protein Kkor_0052 [Kangiella koreensis DSM 16069]